MLLANVYMPTDIECDKQNYLEYVSILQEINYMRGDLDTQHTVTVGDFGLNVVLFPKKM